MSAHEQAREVRLAYLHTASRAAFSICPQMAAYFGNQFHTALGPTRVPDMISRQMCPYCGSVLVDAHSVSRVNISNANSRRRNTKGGATAGRIIKVKLNASAQTISAKATKEERARIAKDRRNCVSYMCAMCSSQIVFPGASTSQLEAAGLSNAQWRTEQRQRKLQTAAGTRHAAEEPKPDTEVEPKPKPKPTYNPAPAKAPTTMPTSKKQKHSASASTPSAIEPQSKKRKKNKKSGLLAMVAANQKKADQKASNSAPAFSLTDFLSDL
ncbi:hypothetical protein DL89DRAFT_268983 [Linderina pennispora]|uniref:Rpr2-domain-containing protein n=1 Tax=Linderina pennispora TaxID=61395 RepID=A0A1Y1W2J5_9FUNG|nr:uncharacterized protein DL89DRAFT_268983 [Linderina pennispora]ORX67770.1 hypothetical protein DL89DRAFT_268983 [Linderina pennispora]